MSKKPTDGEQINKYVERQREVKKKKKSQRIRK